jgi:NAD(P)-dependent dehydrogenase (short-subunit alcohol dehydrogenase family)
MPRPAKVTPNDGCVWITGAASGIGAALTLLMADRGWQVAASDCQDLLLAEVVATAPPGMVQAVPLDITDSAIGGALRRYFKALIAAR